jgi:hypothetical protein
VRARERESDFGNDSLEETPRTECARLIMPLTHTLSPRLGEGFKRVQAIDIGKSDRDQRGLTIKA